MADEPSAPVAQATHAHECNGDREGSPCTDLSESGASIIDGATERLCQPTTFQSGRTDLGLDSARASALTEPLPAAADSLYDAARPISSAPLRVVPITPGPDHPGGVRYEVSYHWNGEPEGDSALAPGDARQDASCTAGATAAAPPVFDPAAEHVPLPGGPDGPAIDEVGASSLLSRNSERLRAASTTSSR